jgi:hypothetical protein
MLALLRVLAVGRGSGRGRTLVRSVARFSIVYIFVSLSRDKELLITGSVRLELRLI